MTNSARARPFPCVVAAAVLAGMSGCVVPRSVDVARADLVGLSRNEVRMCAGFPTRTYTEGNTEVWSYERSSRTAGGVNVPILPTIVGASANLSGGGDCRTQLLFEGNQVRRVAYAGDNDSIAGPDAVCTPIVEECVRYVRSKAATARGGAR